jgi:hypothetical protein
VFTPAQAIAVAASDPVMGPLQRAHPGAYYTAVFDQAKRTWQIRLVAAHGHPVLASFSVLDGVGTVLARAILVRLGPPLLSAPQAAAIAARQAKIRSWLGLFPHTYHTATIGDNRVWTVAWYSGGNEVAEVHIPDGATTPTDVWTGPQVAWMMTRGLPDAYGRKVVSPWVMIPLCLLFVGGLMNWRRPLSMRTLDLVMLLSFVASLWFFDRGDVFVSTPLIYPPLIYLAGRMVWIGFSKGARDVRIGERHLFALVGLVCALMGFRLGLNNRDSNIIDVGYASVVGASRLLHGQAPYGHMPQAHGTPCGGRYGNGDPIGYVQTDHRCESPVENGDTYGPSVYLAYVPAVAVLGWSGRWDTLPAAHVAASAFDILAVLGLFVAGWRLRSASIGVLLAFGWAANPFTLYSLNMNANDGLVGAAVAWALAALSLPWIRGALVAVAGFTKLGPLGMLPVFLGLRHRLATIAGFAIATVLLVSMALLDPHGLRELWDRTIGYQAGRITPMSIWTLGHYHPGWPHLESVQRMLQIAIAIGVLLFAWLPRGRRDGAAVAALCAAAVIGTQLVASYWFYPYVCWWLPAVLLGLFLPRGEQRVVSPSRSA